MIKALNMKAAEDKMLVKERKRKEYHQNIEMQLQVKRDVFELDAPILRTIQYYCERPNPRNLVLQLEQLDSQNSRIYIDMELLDALCRLFRIGRDAARVAVYWRDIELIALALPNSEERAMEGSIYKFSWQSEEGSRSFNVHAPHNFLRVHDGTINHVKKVLERIPLTKDSFVIEKFKQ